MDDNKLHLYASFKSNFRFEPYLDLLPDFKIRSTLAKLRVSAHNLQIEAGRFHKNKTPREERICLYCRKSNSFQVETEVHFLLSFPFYESERQKILEITYRNFPSTISLSEHEMFIWLMSQEDYETTKLLGNFCKTSFEIRTKYCMELKSIV